MIFNLFIFLFLLIQKGGDKRHLTLKLQEIEKWEIRVLTFWREIGNMSHINNISFLQDMLWKGKGVLWVLLWEHLPINVKEVY